MMIFLSSDSKQYVELLGKKKGKMWKELNETTIGYVIVDFCHSICTRSDIIELKTFIFKTRRMLKQNIAHYQAVFIYFPILIEFSGSISIATNNIFSTHKKKMTKAFLLLFSLYLHFVSFSLFFFSFSAHIFFSDSLLLITMNIRYDVFLFQGKHFFVFSFTSISFCSYIIEIQLMQLTDEYSMKM